MSISKATFFFLLVIAILPFRVSAAGIVKAPNNLGLVAYWSFDEGTGATTTDFSGNGNTGTTSASWVNGKKGKALDFNGSNQLVNIGDKIDVGTADFSISLWMYPHSVSDRAILTKGNTECNGSPNFYALTFHPSEIMEFTVRTTGCGDSMGTNTTFVANRWYYVVATRSGTTGKIYVNGVLDNTDTVSSGSVSNGNNLVIGDISAGTWTSANFDGLIDDVRMYNRVLGATEVATLYNSGAARVNAPSNRGLVGYWSFDEGTGTILTDFSGNGNSGTTTGGFAATWVDGKKGKALSFDGVDDSVAVLSLKAFATTYPDFTLSAWVKHAGTDTFFVFSENEAAANKEWVARFSTAGIPTFRYAQTNGTYVSRTATNAILPNVWTYLTYVVNRSGASDTVKIYINGVEETLDSSTVDNTWGQGNAGFRIGKDRDGTGEGIIDDARVYSRVLSAAEILALYNADKTARVNAPSNRGLVGYWSFDEGTGATSTDFSGNNNTGVLTNMDTVNDWVSGKQGKALDFDGSNDGVDAGSATNLDDLAAFTYSAWIYPRSLAGDEFAVIAKGRGAAGVKQILVGDWFGHSDVLIGFIDATTDGNSYSADNTIVINTWQFITMTWAGTGNATKLYKNGEEVTYGGQTAPVTVASDAATNLVIGARDNVSPTFNIPFNGLIDEARVYNRALSAAEVQTLYQMSR